MKKMPHGAVAEIPLPLSRPLQVGAVPPEGLDVLLTASPEECMALAVANGVVNVDRFEARLRIKRMGGDGLDITGVVDATVRQTCVVTLEDFDTIVNEPVDIRFAPQKSTPAPVDEKRRKDTSKHRRYNERVEEEAAILSFDPDGDDPPDPLFNGEVDLGAVAAEFFALGLDPYPRKPDAEFTPPEPDGAKITPFSKLRPASGALKPDTDGD